MRQVEAQDQGGQRLSKIDFDAPVSKYTTEVAEVLLSMILSDLMSLIHLRHCVVISCWRSLPAHRREHFTQTLPAPLNTRLILLAHCGRLACGASR